MLCSESKGHVRATEVIHNDIWPKSCWNGSLRDFIRLITLKASMDAWIVIKQFFQLGSEKMKYFVMAECVSLLHQGHRTATQDVGYYIISSVSL